MHYVILDDGETYSALEGCTIVRIDEANDDALDALWNERREEVIKLADHVIHLVEPREGTQLRLPWESAVQSADTI